MQPEVLAVVADWGQSDATTLDIMPRCLFKMGYQIWDRIAWLIVALAGPGAGREAPHSVSMPREHPQLLAAAMMSQEGASA